MPSYLASSPIHLPIKSRHNVKTTSYDKLNKERYRLICQVLPLNIYATPKELLMQTQSILGSSQILGVLHNLCLGRVHVA